MTEDAAPPAAGVAEPAAVAEEVRA
jgi:hypothetical protein